jgi:hypothetical protein
VRAAVLAVALVLAGSALAAVPYGTPGPDRIDAVNGSRDVIRCGAGRDVVVADQKDVVNADCEVLTRRIALETTPSPAAQYRTIVEPSAAGDGSTVVAVFQSGRIFDGGAAAIGWATSADRGLTWARGLLPDSGAARVSDPVVARDLAHGLWIASVLAIFPSETRLLTYSSPDGVTWNAPVAAATATPPPGETIAFDKGWITCDNGPASPHQGACYLAYTGIRTRTLGLQTSQDGGATWSAAAQLGSQGITDGPTGAIPVLTAGGAVVVVYLVGNVGVVMESATSLDGGVTFAAPVHIATLDLHATPLRAPPLPSVALTVQGIDVVWPDCSAHPGCTSNDIVISTSPNGTSWSAPRAIASGGDYLTPTIGASGDGATAAVLAYVRLPGGVCCKLGVRLFRSSDGGATWGTPARLDAQPMDSAWLAYSLYGRFLGDYMAVAFTGDRPVPVFVAAHAPQAGSLRQDLYATTRLP